LAAAWGSTACAEVQLLPHADVRYEYNSNLFALADNDTSGPPNRPAGTSAADTSLSYSGGVDGHLTWGRQNLTLGADIRRVNYERFSDLDNTGHTYNANLQWLLGDRLDGTLGYTHTRQMAQFADQQGGGTRLQMHVEGNGNLDFRVKLTPDWILLPQVSLRDETTPQEGYPDLGLRETMTGLGLNYAGLGKLTFGIHGDYTDGKFKGVASNAKYTSQTAQFKTSYEATGLSRFNGAIGYTKRDQQGGSPTSAVTGGLGYQREITGKTSASLQFTRSVDSYVAAGSSEIKNAVSLGVNWNATGDLTMGLGYSWAHSTFEGQFLPGTISEGRKDKVQQATFAVDWAVLRWANLRPFARYQKRTSNIDTFTYHGYTYGIELNLRKHGGE
jgi:hypothetical protein